MDALPGSPPRSTAAPADVGARVRSTTWIIAAASAGFAVVQLDVTVVNVALPRIAAQFDASIAALQWVVDAYATAFAVLLLSAGMLTDRLGPRRVCVAGFALFALASAACGLAFDPVSLIGARALQGAGAALLVPSSLAFINRATHHDPSLRARAIGWWTAAGGVSIAAGPVIGGALLETLGWRSIFAVNLPLCAMGACAALGRHGHVERAASLRRFDPVGQLLAMVATGSLVAAIIAMPARGLDHPLTAGLLGAALAAGWALCAAEVRAADPMLPPALLRSPGLAPAVAFGVAVNLTYYGVIFVLSLYLQRVRGYPALAAGFAYLPLTATFIVSNLASPKVTVRYGARVSMVAGAAVGAAGFALLGGLGASSTYASMLPAFALIPGGMGLAVPAMTTVVLAGVDAPCAGIASGVLNAARQIGGAIGVAAFGALAGGDADRIISGLHAAAAVSTALLVGAAATAWIGVAPAARAYRETPS